MPYPEAANSLGKPTHRARSSRWPAIQLAVGRGLALLIVMFIITTPGFVFISVMVLWLLFELFMLWRSRVQLLLAPNGVVQVRNRHVKAMAWRDIESIQQRTNRFALLGGRIKTEEIIFRLNLANGQHRLYSTDQFPTMDQFGEVLLEKHRQYHLPSYIEQFHRGATLEFGAAITAHKEALTLNGAHYSWEQVAASMRLNEQGVQISDGALWKTLVPQERISNAHLLKPIMEAGGALGQGE